MNLSRSLVTVVSAAMGLGVITLAAPAAASSTASAHGSLVISQVYGGGGNAGGLYSHDFVELFNRGSEPVWTTGLSLQYASATGDGAFGTTVGGLAALPSLPVAPGQRVLVRGSAGSGAGGPALPVTDVTSSLPIHHESGKLALVTGTSGLGCNGSASSPCGPAALDRIVDLLGYGTANFAEGASAARLSLSTAAQRGTGGCTDTGDNRADFTASTTLDPRGSAAPATPCATVPQPTAAVEQPAAPVDEPVVAPVDEPVDEPVVAPVDVPLVELTLELEAADPAHAADVVVALVAAAVEQGTAVDSPADQSAPATGTAAPQAGTVATPAVTRHPGCNGIEIAVTKVRAGSAARTVLAAKHADWSCQV